VGANLSHGGLMSLLRRMVSQLVANEPLPHDFVDAALTLTADVVMSLAPTQGLPSTHWVRHLTCSTYPEPRVSWMPSDRIRLRAPPKGSAPWCLGSRCARTDIVCFSSRLTSGRDRAFADYGSAAIQRDTCRRYVQSAFAGDFADGQRASSPISRILFGPFCGPYIEFNITALKGRAICWTRSCRSA